MLFMFFFFFSSRRRHTRFDCDWSSDVCSSDLGISVYSALVFSFLTYAVAIPSAVKTFNWTATLYKGAIWLKAPMIWALAFLGLFLVDRKSTRLNSSHSQISYAVFCLKKKKKKYKHVRYDYLRILHLYSISYL